MKISEIIQAAGFWRHPGYHREIIKHVQWTGDDEKRLDFYSSFIKSGSLVFDIGANMGNRSKIFIKIGADVIAFEPQSRCADFLSFAFSDSPGFTLVQQGLSDHEGEFTMYLGKAHTLATIDTDWLSKMRNGGRFSGHEWDHTEKITLTTLDDAIDKYGAPDFTKIDVEGHEHNVLKGLSTPLRMLSLEFASESLNNIFECLKHLDSLGRYEYRLSLGETMVFSGDNWCNSDEIRSELNTCLANNPLVWGDLYARRVDTRQGHHGT